MPGTLHDTAALMAPGKGILAADESTGTAGKRLATVDLPNTWENRRAYRDLFLSTDGIENYLNGVILFTETMRQENSAGQPFAAALTDKGIIPGVKLDGGAVDFPGFSGEKITEGLDGLARRAEMYYALGARFAKWRSVITIGRDEERGRDLPTPECLHTNAIGLARYSRICQDAGLVPIVEPEVLLTGDHSLARAKEVTTVAVSEVFYQLGRYRVDLSAVILKSSMVVPGKESGEEATPARVASETVEMLKASVPAEVPGVVFLSGGQEPEEATQNLNALAKEEPLPWQLAFSYARAIQGPALEAWAGKEENVPAARKVFLERLTANSLADAGEYVSDATGGPGEGK